MTKIYFNTKTFNCYQHEIAVVSDMTEAELLVMGAKSVEIEKFTNLKAVYRFGVGTDNVPFNYLEKKRIPIFFPSEKTKTILYDSTANFTTFLILYMYYSPLFRKIAEWGKFTREYIAKKNLLVIGAGNIGRRVLKKMQNFMPVTTFDIKKNAMSELKGLIKSSDFISLHIPMSPENNKFIDQEKLSWMKDDMALINSSRGHLVDEDAFYKRLLTTNIRAAFDVFWVEPYIGKLSKLPKEKFFMTPHTASHTKDFLEAGFSEILNIARELDSKK